MTVLIIWTLLLVLVTFVWFTRHSEVERARRRQAILSSRSYPEPPAEPPFVSVLIAARNEEANIERAVRTMLGQDYPNFELIVIDDRSTDRTREILRGLAADDATGRLRVVEVENLPEGWCGKNNAMAQGLRVARGEWLCFGDADCVQTSQRSLSMAVRHALEKQVDFLSVLPRLEMHSTWERLIQPVAGMVMMFAFHPKRVNNPNVPDAYANGAFMLMTRACYEAIGGHAAVRGEVNEDMSMARLAKAGGRRLFVCQNEDLYTVRMYCGLGQIWRGWSRNFYGCLGPSGKLGTAAAMLAGMILLPYVSLVIALVAWAATGMSRTGVGWQWVASAALLAIVMQISVLFRYYGLSRTPPWLALGSGIGAAFCLGMIVDAALKRRGVGAVTWRGTTYSTRPGAGAEGASGTPAGKSVDAEPVTAAAR